MKRGQVTIFVILGVIMLIVFALVLSLNPSPPDKKETDSTSVEPYVEQCLSEYLEEAVETLSMQGGYMPSKNDSIILFEPFRVGYFQPAPSKSTLENDLGELTSTLMQLCSLETYREQGFSIEEGEPVADVTITKNEVIASLNYPLKLKKANTTSRVENFNSKVESRLGQYYEHAKEITKTANERNAVPLSKLVGTGTDNEFHSDIIHVNDSVIFRFFDNKSIPSNYNFAVKLNNTIERREELPEIEPQTAHVGYEFIYPLGFNATAHTDLFDIEDGLINFTPESNDKGKHIIMISKNNSWTHLNLTIKGQNDPPRLDPISDKTISVGEEFNYQVNSRDDGRNFYSAETNLEGFEIDVTRGEINFIPTEDDTGEHEVKIIAIDEYGEKDNETFKLTIN